MADGLSTHDALGFWQATCIDLVRDDDVDLSLRQMAILLTIYLETPPHTVRGLAAKLGVTKPVVTRALNALGARQLVERRRDTTDRRNVLVQRTLQGALYLDRLADTIRRQGDGFTR
ncbi:MAG: winged helix-turn-helix transcriptional regulator [Rhizobiales bacterium]|nr:winged helix-turn-helix transcriptional regulator [Hyphomicrobiales bacterium]